jgi:beta-alanine degradation protein BauB
MLDKTSDSADISAWPPAIAAEFERERTNNKPLRRHRAPVGKRTHAGVDHLASAVTAAPAGHAGPEIVEHVTMKADPLAQHVSDGKTVEYTYAPGETRHETYAAGQFKVHDKHFNAEPEISISLPSEFISVLCHC